MPGATPVADSGIAQSTRTVLIDGRTMTFTEEVAEVLLSH